MKKKNMNKIILTKETISELNGGISSNACFPDTFRSVVATCYTRCSLFISCHPADCLEGLLD